MHYYLNICEEPHNPSHTHKVHQESCYWLPAEKIENISVIIQTVKQLWNVPKSSIPNIVRSIGANVVAPILITTDK